MSADKYYVPIDIVMSDIHIAKFCSTFPDIAPCFQALVAKEVFWANSILTNHNAKSFVEYRADLLIPLIQTSDIIFTKVKENLQNPEILEYLVNNQADYARMPASKCLKWIARGAKAEELKPIYREESGAPVAGEHTYRLAAKATSPLGRR